MAASALLLAAALACKTRSEEQILVDYDIENLPQLLVESLTNLVHEDYLYENTNTAYNEERYNFASRYVAPVPPMQLGHFDISCITSESAFPSLCGYTFDEFSRLFYSLKRPLEFCFPRSPDDRVEGEGRANYCTKRMKLFMFLYRCKVGASFRQMEGLFGWTKSALQRWFHKLAVNISSAMKCYNVDFLRFKGLDWQRAAATQWAQSRLDERVFSLYIDRIRVQNAQHDDGVETIPENVIGSLGAVDGTISCTPAQTSKILRSHGADPNQDRMYCQYKRTHGYKLLAFISHKKGPSGKKYILYVKHSVGSCFDGTLCSSIIAIILLLILAGLFFLGDHAFHRQLAILCPYTTPEINASILDSPVLSQFNHNHSSSRMCSEHGMRYLKSWGIIRGRSDHWLYDTDEEYKHVLRSVWALHNYQVDGCPIIKF
jgi:hypothetical protein